MEFVPNEKATPIRYPSIANLMVDSFDRNADAYPNCSDFQINKKNSLLNGFFTRVGATEVVFEWNTPNVNPGIGNNGIDLVVNGVTTLIPIASGFYTVAAALDQITDVLNASPASAGVTWALSPITGAGAALVATGPPGTTLQLGGTLIAQMSFDVNLSVYTITPGGTVPIVFLASAADLRPTRYVDIVCNQLTNNQAVKDASTAENVRDVLVRWYFDYDNQSPTDVFGFPILMGYAPFFLRRLYNPPKQIQWQSNIPVGNLSLQLYDSRGNIANVNSLTNYMMTLQISEN